MRCGPARVLKSHQTHSVENDRLLFAVEMVILPKFRKEILADHRAKRPVRDGNAYEKSNNLENARHLCDRHPCCAQKRSENASHDQARKSSAYRCNQEKGQPSPKIIGFL